jgi:hypothetical protein
VLKNETESINIGEGYTMKSTGRVPQNFTFIGTPNDGTINKTVAAGTSSLVGNPYPSTLDAQKFIEDNSAFIDGTIYFWEHIGESTTTDVDFEGHGKHGYVGGYSLRNETMGVAASSITNGTAGLGVSVYKAPSQYIAVGQGFFVSSLPETDGTFSFENSQRVYNSDNILLKSTQTKTTVPNFKIGFDYTNATNTKIHRQLGINFKDGNTFNYESGYDSETLDLQETDIYWNFPEVEPNLVIAGVGSIDTQLQIPLEIVVNTEKVVKLMIDDSELMDGYEIMLMDLVTNQTYNLKNAIALNLSQGTYTDRFHISLISKSLHTNDQEAENKLHAYFNTKTKEITITKENGLLLKKVEVFNTFGQQIKKWIYFEDTPEYTLPIDKLSNGVYIIKVTTDKGALSTKFIYNE